MNKRYRVVLYSLLASMAACQHVEPKEITTTLLKSSNQCRLQQAELRLLQPSDTIESVVIRSVIGKSPAPSKIAADFSTQHVVVLAMGKKPTAGYQIAIDTDAWQINGRDLVLAVKFLEPTGDAAAAIISSPCVILAIDKGAYNRIIAGETKLSLKL